MARALLTPDHTLELLAAAPRRIAAATAGVPPALLKTPPAPGEWSVTQVLAHIRACVDVRGAALLRMLAEDHPTIRAMDPRSWMEQTDYPDLEFADSFAVFVREREALVALLGSLPPGGWERTGLVVGAGRPMEKTVHFYADWLAIHERPHLKQIERTMSVLSGEPGAFTPAP